MNIHDPSTRLPFGSDRDVGGGGGQGRGSLEGVSFNDVGGLSYGQTVKLLWVGVTGCDISVVTHSKIGLRYCVHKA